MAKSKSPTTKKKRDEGKAVRASEKSRFVQGTPVPVKLDQIKLVNTPKK